MAEERRQTGQQAGPSPQAAPAQTRKRNTKPVTLSMLKDVRSMFSSLLEENAYWIEDAWVTGLIPPELCGTYYRNGPGLQVTNPKYRRHTLDGDGMVFSLAFKDGKAYFRNRFVRTKGFVAEQAAGRPLFRNAFTRGAADGSWSFNPFDLDFKNVANTGVLPWAGQLYALWEAGLPYLLDPVSLETLRETRMGGKIRTNTFGAHYHIVTEEGLHAAPAPAATQAAADGGSFGGPQQRQEQQQQHAEVGAGAEAQRAAAGAGDGTAGSHRRLVAFSNEFSFSGARAVFYEFDESGALLHETEHALEGVDIALIHDMLVTEHYYVLIVGPIRLHPVKFATEYFLGRCSIAECLVYDDTKPTRIMLFPRPGRPSGKVLPPRVLTTDPFFVFHNVNGFEAEGGEVVVLDTVAWDEVSFELHLYDQDSDDGLREFVGGARQQLTRLTCDLRSGRVERHKLLRRTVEFPAMDPRVVGRPHRVNWFIADTYDDAVLWGPAQSIVRVELDPTMCLSPRAAASLNPHHQQERGLHSQHQPAQREPLAVPLAPPVRAAGAERGAVAGAAAGLAVDEWYLGDRTFPGEPMFVPRPGSSREGEGWLLVGVYNADTQRSDFHIFDAEALSSGPLATIHLPHRLPVSLHGAWDDTYRGPDPRDASVPRWQHLGRARPL